MAKKASKKPETDVEVVFETEPAMEEIAEQEIKPEMEDIFSSRPETVIKEKAKAAVDVVTAKKYANKAVSHMDKVVKAIAFIVAFGVLLVFGAIAAVLLLMDKAFTVIAVAVLAVGIIFALIFLFLIYGMGQIITQNNEILKRL